MEEVMRHMVIRSWMNWQIIYSMSSQGLKVSIGVAYIG